MCVQLVSKWSETLKKLHAKSKLKCIGVEWMAEGYHVISRALDPTGRSPEAILNGHKPADMQNNCNQRFSLEDVGFILREEQSPSLKRDRELSMESHRVANISSPIPGDGSSGRRMHRRFMSL